jgi:hypothetical protein
MRSRFVAACFVLLFTLPVLATRYVSTKGGNQAPYDTWARAARDIQTAVNAAGVGETILVNNGEYNITASILLGDNQTLKSVNGRSVTTIRANHAVRCVGIYYGTLDGFSLRDGRAAASDGAGVIINTAGTVRNCDIRECSAGLSGGGVALVNGGLVEDCLIYDNHADDPGGGVSIYRAGTVRNCAINSNDVSGTALNWGGGVGMREGGLVEFCQINDNRADEDGGGVHMIDGGEMRNCTIVSNMALLNGGGVFIMNSGTVKRCLIRQNICTGLWPDGRGGGVFIEGAGAALQNCSVMLNSASDRAGGIMINVCGYVRGAAVFNNYAEYYGGGIVINGAGNVGHATIVNNSAGSQRGGGVHCIGGGSLANSVIYNNTAGAGDPDFFDESGGGWYDHCCIPTTPARQNGTINGNPEFLQASGYDDFRPCPINSPLIDAGPDFWSGMEWASDLRGTSRKIGGQRDIGAFEAYGAENNMIMTLNGSDCVAYRAGTWYFRDIDGGDELNGSWGYAGALPVPGDFNRNQHHDRAVFDPRTGNWFIRDDLGGYTWGFNWGWPGAIPVSGDYDGDGATDLAVFDINTSSWYIYSIYSSSVIRWGFQFGFRGMTPISGDFDGDGIDDPAVFYPPTGVWYIYSLANNRPIVWGRTWGYAGCVPVSGDFDGDGCDDLAVYDPARYRWFIRTASDYPISGGPSVLLWDYAWGFPGATALAGDYNYDGRSDICTYSPSAYKFYAYSLTGHMLAWGLQCPTSGGGPGTVAVKK